MATFENINSASVRLSLEKQIQSAVSLAVEPLLRSGGWRTYAGPFQEQLNSELASVIGNDHAGLCCSGSAALETLLRACRLETNDEVLLSGYDYPGNFTAIENAGGLPVLVDVEPNSWNISFEALEHSWSPRCKALVVSHLHGQLQNLEMIAPWCRQHNLTLIQDACQALGASPGGQKLGVWADATVLSFGGSKTLSAGRGGAWCTSDPALAQRARVAAGVGSGAYEMSELQAAIILAQLPYLQRITERCREYFSRQLTQLSCIPGIYAPWAAQLDLTAFYQAGWFLPLKETSTPDSMPEGAPTRSTIQVADMAEKAGVETGVGFQGFHRRSEKRCRIPSPLSNTAETVSRTATLHHREALR